jgi:pyruvate dehydrogenase E2 component (dihydrolipoamide acetyltransferase)
MAVSIVMPALEMAQETGKLIAWRKREGEEVRKGEPLVEIETDKAVMEIESPADGILAGVKAEIGAVVPVGQTIAWIVAPGEKPPIEMPPAPMPTASTSEPRPGRRTLNETGRTRPRMSPKARRLARELAIETSSLRGSGPGEALVARDILGRPDAKATDAPVQTQALGSVARLMGERTTRSWTEVPHFFLTREVDAGALIEIRERLAERCEREHGVRPTLTDLLVAVVARVVGAHPRLNSSWTPEGVRLHPAVHMAVAVAVEGGVTSVVIRDAHRASVPEISLRRRELTARARAGRLRPADIQDGTFTLSNLGMYEVDSFQAIIQAPQAAILAIGRIADRIVPVDGRPAVRPMMHVTVSCDHRVVDGAGGALFLKDLVEAMQHADEKLE